ncbi:MAG: PadR family transcriptional regulator [Thermoleophilia bacterium]
MSPTYALLGLLLNGQQHGYCLKRTIDQEYAPFWRIDHAQLYRSLAKLARAGWVTARTEPGVGAPERKVYALSAEGKRVFVAWLSEPADDRNEFFVKLRLAHESHAPIAPLVEARRHLLNHERLARLQARNVAAESGDIGRLALARAALHETEAHLAELHLCRPLASQERTTAYDGGSQTTVIAGSDPR